MARKRAPKRVSFFYFSSSGKAGHDGLSAWASGVASSQRNMVSECNLQSLAAVPLPASYIDVLVLVLVVPLLQATNALEWGWCPQQVIADLADIGNWKVSAAGLCVPLHISCMQTLPPVVNAPASIYTHRASVAVAMRALHTLQSRASAVDSLHKALRDVPNKSQIIPGLPRFASFLVALVADPNFKIAISSGWGMVCAAGGCLHPLLWRALCA